MRRSSFLSFLKEKSFIIVLALMLVSAGTMTALFFTGGEDRTGEDQVARQEINAGKVPGQTTETKEKEQKTGTQNEEEKKQAEPVKRSVILPSREMASEEPGNRDILQAELEDQYLESLELAEASTGEVVAEEFSQIAELSLQWPVEGEILLEYAMDHSIYFPTLAQYQYNPALIIGAAEGTSVHCAAAGTVIDVGKTNEYGHYVTMDLGDGYEIVYGQLFDITTEVGEILEAGDAIAKVAYPTRSYTQEGENLYLKLTKDGVSVDPELYLKK